VTADYRRLAAKRNAFTEKSEQEKIKLAEAHGVELAKLGKDLDLGTHSYMEYRQTVCHGHRQLHEIGA
jgi:hypothetical protein